MTRKILTIFGGFAAVSLVVAIVIPGLLVPG